MLLIAVTIAASLFLTETAAKNILVGGAVISITEPKKGALITGSFAPETALQLYEGPMADSIRADPFSVAVCSALDGDLVRCIPLVEGDGVRTFPKVGQTYFMI